MLNKIFVYGTLRKGYGSRHGMLQEDGEFLGVAYSTNKIMYDLGAFPGVIHSDNEEDVIVGEVYTMNDPQETIAYLDVIEGVPTLYRREKVRVSLENGEELTTWMYIYNAQTTRSYNRVASGDYYVVESAQA